MTNDFYQVPPIKDKWVSKRLEEGLDALAPSFWHTRVKGYKLVQIMQQSDLVFFEILNKFRTISQTAKDIEYINDLYFRLPPKDPTIPRLFYTSILVQTDNNMIIPKHKVQHVFLTQYTYVTRTCPPFYRIPNDQANPQVYTQPFALRKICWLKFVRETTQHMMAFTAPMACLKSLSYFPVKFLYG